MAKTKVVRGTCTVPGCDRPHKARGYCPAHLQRHMRGVEVAVPLRSRVTVSLPQCMEEGCRSPVQSKGLCQTHYRRLLRHGHTRFPDRKRPPKPCAVVGCESFLYAKGMCHQHYIQERSLLSNYGITPKDFAAMLESQSGVCAICGGVQRSVNGPSGKVTELHVDHCHKTNTVRGLLCSHCNRAIGLLGDDPATIRRAADYLERATPS